MILNLFWTPINEVDKLKFEWLAALFYKRTDNECWLWLISYLKWRAFDRPKRRVGLFSSPYSILDQNGKIVAET